MDNDKEQKIETVGTLSTRIERVTTIGTVFMIVSGLILLGLFIFGYNQEVINTEIYLCDVLDTMPDERKEDSDTITMESSDCIILQDNGEFQVISCDALSDKER